MSSKRKNNDDTAAELLKKEKASLSQLGPDPSNSENHIFFEGDRCTDLFELIHRSIESERLENKLLPEKIWFKKQFAIGMNEVTRCLERMPPAISKIHREAQSPQDQGHTDASGSHFTFTAKNHLQAVIVDWDCKPKWLTKHLPSLADSRAVPIICIRKLKDGSFRLGKLFNMRTAIAVGVKANGNGINQLIEKILIREELNDEDEKLDRVQLSMTPPLEQGH